MIRHWIPFYSADYLRGAKEGLCEIHYPLSWFPLVLFHNENDVLCAPLPTAGWSLWVLLWPFSTLLHQSQNSHCSALMQNAVTFSIRTSLSQEVNRKHISHCVPAALILLMAKTPWRQIDLSLFSKLWVKRKYIWHLYSMRALSIWCIKEGWRRGEVHITYLIWLEPCPEEGLVFSIFFLLLNKSSTSDKGIQDLTFQSTNSGKNNFQPGRTLYRICSEMWPKRVQQCGYLAAFSMIQLVYLLPFCDICVRH